MDLEQLKHVTHIVAVTELLWLCPRASKLFHISRYSNTLSLLTPLTDPILCAPWYLDKKKKDRMATGQEKKSPGGSGWRVLREKNVLGKCFLMLLNPSDPQVLTPLLWDGAATLF